MKILKYTAITLIIALSFAASCIAAGPLDTNSGQPAEYNSQPQHNMADMETPPEAYQKKPMPKEGITLFNLPWDVPWGGIFTVAFLVFAPFLYIIGMSIYKSFSKKKEPKQNQ